MVDLLSDLALFLAIAGGTIAGLYVGGWLLLGMAGQFVEETLREIRMLVFETLANRTLQDLIKAADKIPAVAGKGGILEKLGDLAKRFLG